MGGNLWVWLVGVVVRRYIDFLILLILLRSFLLQHPYFLFIFKMFLKVYNGCNCHHNDYKSLIMMIILVFALKMFFNIYIYIYIYIKF